MAKIDVTSDKEIGHKTPISNRKVTQFYPDLHQNRFDLSRNLSDTDIIADISLKNLSMNNLSLSSVTKDRSNVIRGKSLDETECHLSSTFKKLNDQVSSSSRLCKQNSIELTVPEENSKSSREEWQSI